MSRLEVVDRPAANGDFVTLDFVGTIDGEPFEGGEGRDQLVEVGAGRLIPGFEEGLVGVSAGEEKTVDATFPDDYAAKHVAGKPAAVPVHASRRSSTRTSRSSTTSSPRTPRATTRSRSCASRSPRSCSSTTRPASRPSSAPARWTPSSTRRRSTCPSRSSPRAPRSCWIACCTRSAIRGSPRQAYLQITGKTEDELIEESKPDAELALRREAVLAAVIEAEKIEPTEAQLLDALEEAATREQTSRQKLLDRLRQAGRVDMLIKEVAAEQAIDLVVTTAVPVAPEEAEGKPAKKAAPKKAAAKKKPAAKKPAAKKKAPAKQQADERRRAVDARAGRGGEEGQALDARHLSRPAPRPEAFRTRVGRLVRCPGRDSHDDD